MLDKDVVTKVGGWLGLKQGLPEEISAASFHLTALGNRPISISAWPRHTILPFN